MKKDLDLIYSSVSRISETNIIHLHFFQLEILEFATFPICTHFLTERGGCNRAIGDRTQQSVYMYQGQLKT